MKVAIGGMARTGRIGCSENNLRKSESTQLSGVKLLYDSIGIYHRRVSTKYTEMSYEVRAATYSLESTVPQPASH